MNIINYSHAPDPQKVFEALRQDAILVSLNNVYALMSLANESGVKAIDRVKIRKAGKSYGSMVTDANRFFDEARIDEELKGTLRSIGKSGVLEGTFIRLPWSQNALDGLVMNGTHQGLILGEPVRSFCMEIEENFKYQLGGEMIPSLICSSANISGDSNGSITNRETAIKFGIDRGIKLFVEFDFEEIVEKGSFPIFTIYNGGYRVERNGPRRAFIESKIKDAGLIQRI